MLVNMFHWSLKDLDETDCESLMDFVNRMNETGGDLKESEQEVFCDEAPWL